MSFTLFLWMFDKALLFFPQRPPYLIPKHTGDLFGHLTFLKLWTGVLWSKGLHAFQATSPNTYKVCATTSFLFQRLHKAWNTPTQLPARRIALLARANALVCVTLNTVIIYYVSIGPVIFSFQLDSTETRCLVMMRHLVNSLLNTLFNLPNVHHSI